MKTDPPARPDKNLSTEEDLDQIRERDIEETETSGGMGREGTPRDGKTQGTWERPDGN